MVAILDALAAGSATTAEIARRLGDAYSVETEGDDTVEAVIAARSGELLTLGLVRRLRA